jgi:hypothetical protein
MSLKTLTFALASTIFGAATAFAGDCGEAVLPGKAVCGHVPEIGANGGLAAIVAVAALAAIIVERRRRA